MPKIRLAVFDMAGTTVDDVIDGMPLVLRSYDDAFRKHGVIVPMETLNDMRGRDKREVINMLGGEKAPAIYKDFVEMLTKNVSRVKEIQGTSETFRWLKEHGVAVGVESGQVNAMTIGWATIGVIWRRPSRPRVSQTMAPV